MADIESVTKDSFSWIEWSPSSSPIGDPMTLGEVSVSMMVPVETTK